MAQIQAAIFARASAFAALTDLIGTSPVRLYPVDAPQETGVPYVTFQVVSAPRQHEMGADSLGLPRVQFDCWGRNRAEALAVRDAVLAAFDRWEGTFASVVVRSSICVNSGVDVQQEPTTQSRRVTLEFEMAHDP